MEIADLKRVKAELTELYDDAREEGNAGHQARFSAAVDAIDELLEYQETLLDEMRKANPQGR